MSDQAGILPFVAPGRTFVVKKENSPSDKILQKIGGFIRFLVLFQLLISTHSSKLEVSFKNYYLILTTRSVVKVTTDIN